MYVSNVKGSSSTHTHTQLVVWWFGYGNVKECRGDKWMKKVMAICFLKRKQSNASVRIVWCSRVGYYKIRRPATKWNGVLSQFSIRWRAHSLYLHLLMWSLSLATDNGPVSTTVLSASMVLCVLCVLLQYDSLTDGDCEYRTMVVLLLCFDGIYMYVYSIPAVRFMQDTRFNLYSYTQQISTAIFQAKRDIEK